MVECEVKYKVFDVTGEYAADPEKAEMLHERIMTALNDGQTVELVRGRRTYYRAVLR
jgi:hypothetical protein